MKDGFKAGTVLCSLLFCLHSVAAEKWALLIGIANYRDPTVRKLNYSEKDVAYLKNILIQYARFKDQNVRILLGEQATYLNMKDAIWWLGDNARPDDAVFFVFSGHGTRVEDPEGDEPDGLDEAFCPYDTDPKKPSTVITDDDFGKWFRRIRSRNEVLILDCCYSGGAAGKSLEDDRAKGIDMTAGPGSKGGLDFEADPYAKDLTPEGRFIMTASDADEKSYEEPRLEHGIFSYFVGEALKGGGDMDHDRKVSIEDVYNYSREKTLQKAREIGKKQTPMRFGSLTDFVVTSVGSQRCEVINIDRDLGRVFIRIDGSAVKKGDKFKVKKQVSGDEAAKDLEIMDESIFEVEVDQVLTGYSKAKILRSFYTNLSPTSFSDYYAEKTVTGGIKIRTNPWAKVTVDGMEKGYSPMILETIEAGEHQITYEFGRAGMAPFTEKVVVEENKIRVIDKDFTAKR